MALPAGDPYWYYKVLGLHCDGTNNSTTFTDVKGKTVTANGDAKISTAQYPALTGKTSSCLLDGTGDYLSLADNDDLELGSGNFTLRAKIRIVGWSPSHGGTYYAILFAKDSSTGRSYNLQLLGTSSSFTTLRFYGFSDNVTYTTVDGAFSFALDTWYDIEATRSGDNVYLFVDGTLLNSGGTAFSRTLQSTTQVLKIGAHIYDGTYLGYLNGYISEVEIYKGVALHTANYTPSSDPFPDTYVRVSGTTRDAGGGLAPRLVRVYRRDTGALVGQVVSDATTGEYAVTAPNSGTTTPLKHVAYMHATENGVHVPWRVLGLHCDGTNTSTTFTDVKGKTVTAVGNAQISTAQYPSLTGKTSSGYVDGTGDYLSSAASSDFNFGTGDFTIRCMFYLAGNSAVDGGGNRNARLFCLSNATTTFDIDVEIQGDASTTGIGIAFYSSANGLFSRTVTITKDVWHDIEVSRSGTSLRLFLDGTQLGATFTNSASWGSSTSGAYVGGAPFASNYYFYLNGYISEVEVYKGVALHTEDFTPLTVPFYDEIGTATENAIIYDNITPY